MGRRRRFVRLLDVVVRLVTKFFGPRIERIARQAGGIALDGLPGQVGRVAFDSVEAFERGKRWLDGIDRREKARSQGSGKGRIAFGRDPLPKHLDARPWPWRIVRRRKFDPELIVGR